VFYLAAAVGGCSGTRKGLFLQEGDHFWWHHFWYFVDFLSSIKIPAKS
jgi:hypothetical protein